jgi:hypothetical protein
MVLTGIVRGKPIHLQHFCNPFEIREFLSAFFAARFMLQLKKAEYN